MSDPGPALDHRHLPDLPPAPQAGGTAPAYGFKKDGKYWMYKYVIYLVGKEEPIIDHSTYEWRAALRDTSSEDHRRMISWIWINGQPDMMVHFNKQSIRASMIERIEDRYVVAVDDHNARSVR